MYSLDLANVLGTKKRDITICWYLQRSTWNTFSM